MEEMVLGHPNMPKRGRSEKCVLLTNIRKPD